MWLQVRQGKAVLELKSTAPSKWNHRYTHLQQASSSNNAPYMYPESIHPKSPPEHTTLTQVVHGLPQAHAAIVSLI
jgi:hypothetical protein